MEVITETTPAAKKCTRNGNHRYLKQAIVDKNALVSSSALVSGILLYKISPEVTYENKTSNEQRGARVYIYIYYIIYLVCMTVSG